MYTKTIKTPADGRLPQYPMLLTPEALRAIFVSCADFQIRQISLGLAGGRCAWVCWLDGLVKGEQVSESIIRPLTSALRTDGAASSRQSLELAMAGAVYS